MANHPPTPGPWYIEPGTLTILSEVAGNATICEVMEADDFPCVEEGTEADVQAECEANARLIAAAPEMLDALRTAEKIVGREFPNGQGIIDIRAAIAKAEGRS